jgi:IMP dehydrogenase
MGSLGAMRDSKSSRLRYKQEAPASGKVVPEGAEASVPYQGPLAEVLFQYVGGVRSGLGYTGSQTIADHRANARFIQMTASGLAESRPHDVTLTEAPPNYGGQS